MTNKGTVENKNEISNQGTINNSNDKLVNSGDIDMNNAVITPESGGSVSNIGKIINTVKLAGTQPTGNGVVAVFDPDNPPCYLDADGCKLSAEQGITVSEMGSLTIYAQSTDESKMGQLIAGSDRGMGAGIGGAPWGIGAFGNIMINGGVVNATGSDNLGSSTGTGGVGIGGDCVTVEITGTGNLL